MLNHLSVKYPDPEAREANGGESDDTTTTSREKWTRMLREIERQAERAFRGITETDADLRTVEESVVVKEEGTAAVMTARDFLEIELPRRDKLARGGKSK